MPTPLLETKFYLPKPARRAVPRPRLTERLDGVVESKLALVSAPAGFARRLNDLDPSVQAGA